MNEVWRLARRDLRGGLGGLGLLWLCLVIAIAGIASVTSLASSIDHAIAANGRTIIGGDLVLRVPQREATEDERAAMARIGPMSHSMTLRAMVVGPHGDSGLAELSSIDARFPLAGEIRFSGGGTRPQGREVAIGRDLAERLGLQRGSQVRIGYARFQVSGVIEQMPAMSGFALAAPALMDSAGLTATGLVQPGSLTTSSYRFLLPPAANPQAVGKAFQARFPDGGWSVTDRNDAGSGTRRFVERVAELLLMVALAALVIGGLGIGSAARAFATSRTTTIATLKLLGGRRNTLAGMLGLEVMLIAVLGILIGLAIGAAAPSVAAHALGNSLPIRPDTAPQWQALALSAAFGLLVTVAAAWAPIADAVATRPATLFRGDVASASRRRLRIVPVLALLGATALAIATAADPRFAATGFAIIAALALLFASLGWTIKRIARRLRHRGGPITRLGIAALDRPGAATVRLSVALGLGLALLVTLAGVAQSLLREIDTDVPVRAPALFLIDIPAAQQARFRQLAGATAPGADLRLVPSLRGPITAIKGVQVADLGPVPEGAWILRGDRGLTFARDLPPGNRITAGRWWPANYSGPPLVSLDADAGRALRLKVGDSITIAILGRPIEAKIASFREIDWRSLGFNFAVIFAPGTLEQAPFTLMATVSPVPGVTTAKLERALASDLPMVSAIRVADVVAQVRQLLEALAAAVRVATGVALLLGVIVLAGAVVAARASRARDLVLLKLVGATRGQVLVSQLIEFAILGTTVTLAAFGLGILAADELLIRSFDLSFRPDWPSLAALAFGAILVTIGAALIAVWPALRTRPATALRTL